MRIETAIAIGSVQRNAPSETPTSTTMAASVAYATDEIASAEKIGSASEIGRSWSSIWPDAIGRPTT